MNPYGLAAGIGISALAPTLVPAQLTAFGPGHRLPELGAIDLVLMTNPRTDQRPAVRALISAVLASGSWARVASDQGSSGQASAERLSWAGG